MKKIYFDYAAATPMDTEVLSAMRPYFAKHFYNPSALYLDAKKVAQDIANARSKIASWLGARPGEIIFTAGGTEANNLAIHGIMRSYPDANILISAIEHESVHMPAQEYGNLEIKVDAQGVVDLADLENKITDKTVLISIIYANNEIGTIQPITKIAHTIHRIKKERQQKTNKYPLYLHIDACQASAYLDLSVSRLGVDLMTVNSGKIYGPKQCGALYINKNVDPRPLINGGGQEFGLRSGTENVPAIIGFAKALDRAQDNRHQEAIRIQNLQQFFFQLLEEKIPDSYVNGSKKYRLPNNVHITIPGYDNERLVMGLDEAGIQCSSGSACNASNIEPSRVLKAIGLSAVAAQSSLRFSMGKGTDENAVVIAVDTLVKIIA